MGSGLLWLVETDKGGNVRIKATVNSPFQDCRVDVLQHVNHICLQLRGDSQRVWLRGERDEVRQLLKWVLAELEPKDISILEKTVRDLTPAEVVAYFYQSPVLASMAEDVKAALENCDSETTHVSDIEIIKRNIDPRDLFVEGKPIWGAQKRIAEILQIPNAGSYRRNRILPALALLQQQLSTNSTTTTRPVEKSRKAA